MALSPERLREIVLELLSRPGHEKTRTDVHTLLVDGLGASSAEVYLERPVPEVHGRIDALLGRTVFEFKSDLRREAHDATEQLTRYIRQREAETGEHFVGIATDGASFVAYELRAGTLRRLDTYSPRPTEPRGLLAWLGSAVAVSAELDPEPEIVSRELGRQSLAWHVARAELAGLWQETNGRPDVRLKREIWARLLERVYGSSVDADDLFFQHTYLTIVAKTMAVHVLGISLPTPADLLAGKPFLEAGITGAVESDFFDWVLAAPRGDDLVRRIALQAGRFRLHDVHADVLKGLYESLVDPEQRHELGEYYTPDWLAARMCEHAIDRPLEQRVLDPACGSGTFLFHAIRRLLAAADAARLSNREALSLCCNRVLGVDVHPVAVQIARVTYLLAIGEERLRDRPALTIPVYLGDSLQWNTRGLLAEREVLIEVPDGGPLLAFPFAVARDPNLFDRVIDQMLRLSEEGAGPEALAAWLAREHPLDADSSETLANTYVALRDLRRSGRNHIWGFVARNLVRPVWLSQEDQRADIIVGNPPWLSYRYMSRENQQRFREECQRRGLWAGGKVATHQDMSSYFFAKCVELYLKPTGLIAFVMPYAALTRRQFVGFRSGLFATRRGKSTEEVFAQVQFPSAWVMDSNVQPLFPVPSSAIFAVQARPQGRTLPATVQAASGALPRRDATMEQATRALAWQEVPWPEVAEDETPASPYRNRFHQGATMVPRMLCVVEQASVGAIGGNPAAPVVQSRRTSQEKPPWKTLPPLRDNVESQFLRPLYLGESIAPFRLLEPVLGVIPWEKDSRQLVDAAAAQGRGYVHLARWLRQAERLWREHSRGGMTLLEQLDYYGKLSAQLPPRALRIVFAASGTLPAAAFLRDSEALVEHALYWAPIVEVNEAYYLQAVLNSEIARKRVAELQSQGQWGARHFDKVMLSLPIPRFTSANTLHQELTEAAAHAERVAGAVPLQEGTHFVRARQQIRAALRDEGIAARMEGLVAALLGRPT